MRAMKDSGIEWIGQVPESWEVRSLKFALNAHSGGAWGTNEGGNETDIICVRVADFEYAKLLVDFHDKMTVRSYTDKAIAESSLKHGDILLEKSGGGEVTPVGRSVLFTGEDGMMCANFIEWLRPNQHFNSCFLNYWLSAAYINGFSKRNVKQTTGIQNLDVPAFLSEKIVAPSVLEQKRIAEYLDAKCAEIDALIAAKEKTNALLKERRQSVIYEAVTKGLNPDAPMKDSGIEWIGRIPEHWERISLKYCIQHVGSGTSVNAEERPANTDELGVLKTSCVSSGAFVAVENKTILEGEHTRASCPVKADTVIVSRMNTPDLVGACGYVEEDYPNLYLPDRLWQVEFSEDCIAKYMWYFLTSKYVRNYYASVCTGTSGSMQNISQEQFGAITFFKPTKGEQQQIVEQLDKECNALMLLIEINEISLRKLREYRQSIIYEAVTGKNEI